MTDLLFKVRNSYSIPTIVWLPVFTFILLLVMGVFSEHAHAQRNIQYPALANMSNRSSIYFDAFKLPGKTDSTLHFVLTFRIDFSRLPFKKMEEPRISGNKEYRFYSVTSLNADVFKDNGKSTQKKLDLSDENLSVLEPVARSFWRDTVYAETYEQTRSNKNYHSGYLHAELQPGHYGYVLQLNRQSGMDDELSRKQQLTLKAYNSKNDAPAYFLDAIDSTASQPALKLLNFGHNVYYGKNFKVLMLLPDYQPDQEYTLEIKKLNIANKDTTAEASVYTYQIPSSDILQHRRAGLNADSTQTSLKLDPTAPGQGYTYALVNIPNRKFPNSAYRLEVRTDDQTTPVIRKFFRSRWIDMPTSLLNLDISIDMLSYIVDESKIKELKKGSFEQKEKKFRSFWEERDPTPDTEYNELMAEYYRRIDYAFEHFSSMQQPGFNTDQGKIYIKYGPPNNIERRLPSGEPAIEIWYYPNRQFIFQATSGFGDYQLISNRQ